jgi:pimeloyl-ACP methyl ester carboxylesterase
MNAQPEETNMQLAKLLDFLAHEAADIVCFESPDLTTANTLPPPDGPTTPADNSLDYLPPGAFTPQTDRLIISPNPPDRTLLTRQVPGVQVQARFAGDLEKQARFLLRFPTDWNGRLVVAGASGTRSEFNGDFAWSDFVVQKGFAYASQNKGVLNFHRSTSDDPLACRLNPLSSDFIHFYANDPAKPFTQWAEYMIRAAHLARAAVHAHYGRPPQRTYAVGTSNGGYQVRRAIELASGLFDGGLECAGTFVDPNGPNLLIDLPHAIRNFPAYQASGFAPDSEAAQNIREAGYPPDIVHNGASLWGVHASQFWEITLCLLQKRFDPTYDTYGAGPANYDYSARRAMTQRLASNLAALATTGKITRPLISIAGTLDALLPITHHARAYQARVAASREGKDHPQYRLYEIENGNHVDLFRSFFPQLELLQPHAHRAFDLLVDHVETGTSLPPDQCIPRGGRITGASGLIQ